jgi:hypothetical protein
VSQGDEGGVGLVPWSDGPGDGRNKFHGKGPVVEAAGKLPRSEVVGIYERRGMASSGCTVEITKLPVNITGS